MYWFNVRYNEGVNLVGTSELVNSTCRGIGTEVKYCIDWRNCD